MYTNIKLNYNSKTMSITTELEKLISQNFNPNLFKPGFATRIGLRNAEQLKNEIPIVGISNHLREMWNEKRNIVGFLKAGAGAGKSLTMPPFLQYTFNTDVVLVVPLVSIVESVIRNITKFYDNYVLGQNLAYYTGKKDSTGVRTKVEPGITVMTMGIALQMIPETIFGDGASPNVLFIIDEFHNRSSNDIYICVRRFLQKIYNDESVAVVFMSATIDIDRTIEYFRQSFEQSSHKKNVTEESYGLANFDHCIMEVMGQQNSQRLLKFLETDADNIYERSLAFIKRCKTDTKSEEYKFLTEKSAKNVLIFISGAREFDEAAAYFNQHRSELPEFIIVKSTSQTHREGTGNTHLLNIDINIKPFLILFATDFLQEGVTIKNMGIVIMTGHTKKDYYNIFTKNVTVTEHLPTKFSLIQQEGRAGRDNPGVALKLMTEDVYDMLPQSMGAVTAGNLDYYTLSLAETSPSSLTDGIMPELDPVNATILLDSISRLFIWNLIDIKMRITNTGKAVKNISVARLSVKEAYIVILAVRYDVPLQLVVIMNLLIKMTQAKGKLPGGKGDEKQTSFRRLFERTLEIYTSEDAPVFDELDTEYVNIITALNAINIKLEYETQVLNYIKVYKEKLFDSFITIYSTAYHEFTYTYKDRLKKFSLPNNQLFSVEDLKKHHLGPNYKNPKNDDKLFSVGLKALTLANGYTKIVPEAVNDI